MMRWKSHLSKTAMVMAVAVFVAACSTSSESDPTTSEAGTPTSGGSVTETTAPASGGTAVPPIRFLGPTAAYEEALFEANKIMIANWEALGFTVEQTLLGDVGEILDAANPREYEALSFGYGGRIDRIDPNDLVSSPFLCEFAGVDGSNRSDYCNPAYDELVAAQKQETDINERQQIVFQLQELQARDLAWLTVYHNQEVYGYNSDAYGNVVESVVVGASNFQNYVEAEPLTDDRIFRFGSDSVWRTMNPTGVESYNQEVEIQKLVFDTLAKVLPDGTVGPHLAESWEFTDETTLVVDIVSPATFHDGEPLTADDVKFSYDYFKEWDVGNYINALSEIESVEVIDEDTVQLNLVAPSSTVLFSALTNIMILPEHIWATVVDDNGLSHPNEWTETQMVGSGPFVVNTVVAGEAVELDRNDDWWGGDIPSDGVQAIFFGDSQGLMRALQDGTIYFHQHGALAPDARQQVLSGELPGITGGSVGSVETRGVALRMSDGSPFQDYYVRLALAHTIDKAFAADVANRGFADRGTGTISPGNPFWFNPDIPQENGEIGSTYWPQLDMERARQILTDAGYTWDEDGKIQYPSADYVPSQVLAPES